MISSGGANSFRRKKKAMKYKKLVLSSTAVALSLLAVSSAPAQQASAAAPASEKVCLQNNRIWGFDVVDERTLAVTDRNYKRYTVHMRSGCVGLTKVVLDIRVRSTTALGCLGQGDFVSFRSPGLGRLSCAVSGVENYMPASPPQQGG